MLRPAAALCCTVLLLSAADAAFASTEPVTLSFTPCGGMICIPVTLADGKSHLLLLDTGNVNSWLSADTAKGLNIKLEPIEQDGKALPGLFRLGAQTVTLQGRAFSGRFLGLAPEQTGELPPNVEGGLAYTLFKDQVLQIDYPHLTVRILESQPKGLAANSSALKLITFGKDGPPIVVGSGFSVNGKAVNAQIDTCYTGTLLVYDQAIDGLGLKGAAARKGQPKYFPYTDGGVNMNEAAADSVAFGPYALSRAPATIYFSGTGRNPVHQPDGLFEATVGNALFVHSVLTLDFHAMKVSVQPG